MVGETIREPRETQSPRIEDIEGVQSHKARPPSPGV